MAKQSRNGTQASAFPDFRWWVLVVISLGLVASQFTVTLYSPILHQISVDLNVDSTTAVMLLTAITFGAVISLIVGGFIYDRFGVMAVVVIDLICLAVPAFLMPTVGHSFQSVFIARIVQGFSVGVVGTMAPMMAAWFAPKEKGIVLGCLGGALTLGGALGAATSGLLLEAYGTWQMVAFVAGFPAVVVLLLAIYVIFFKKPHEFENAHYFHGPGSEVGLTLKQAPRTSSFWVCALLAFFAQWVMLSLWNMTPAFLASPAPIGVGYGSVTAGLLSLAIMVAGTVSPFIAGWAMTRLLKNNSKPLIFVSFLAAGIAMYLVTQPFINTVPLALVILMLVAGAFVTIIDPAIHAFVSMNFNRRYLGRITGIALGLGSLGGVLGLILDDVGIGMAHGYLGAGLLVAAGGGFLGFLFTLVLRRPAGHEELDRLAAETEAAMLAASLETKAAAMASSRETAATAK